MLVNKIIPIDVKERVCVHCHPEGRPDPIVYLIAEPQQGKTTETIRQAVFRRDTILSTEDNFYKSAGMKHASEAGEVEVSYMGLNDIFNEDFKIQGRTLNLCVDNARAVLESILSERFGVPVKIDFMALEA